MDKKKYFFCGSSQVFTRALAEKNALLLIQSEDFEEVCKDLGREYIKFEKFSFWDFILHPGKVRIELNRLMAILDAAALHFSHTQFSVFCFLLVAFYARKNGKVFFHDFEIVYEKNQSILFNRSYLKALLTKIIVRLHYGVQLTIKTISGIGVIGINETFFSKYSVERICEIKTFNKIISEGLTEQQIPLDKSRAVFFTQNLLNYSYFVTRKSLLRVYQVINQSKDCMIKYHPNMIEQERTTFSGRQSLPDYYPAEVLFANIEESVISVHSAVLISASFFQGIVPVSVMDLLEWKNEKDRLKIKYDLIQRSNNQIVFVQNFEELKEYL